MTYVAFRVVAPEAAVGEPIHRAVLADLVGGVPLLVEIESDFEELFDRELASFHDDRPLRDEDDRLSEDICGR